MKILFIANPSSGGSEIETVSSIEGLLSAAGDVRRLEPSQERFNVEVAQAAQDRGMVVVDGGD